VPVWPSGRSGSVYNQSFNIAERDGLVSHWNAIPPEPRETTLRIRRIQIKRWRHFENIDLQLDPDAGLVCIVGANGTGKSHLLELIAACAHHLGLAPGIELARGNPFSDSHDFVLQFFVATGISTAVEAAVAGEPAFASWDRTLTIESSNASGTNIRAGGLEEIEAGSRLAGLVIGRLRASQDVYFLSLDADRSYPKKDYNIHQVAEAYEIDWAGIEYTRGRSYRPTTTLYDEWLKYFLAQENQSGTKLIQEIRRAKKSGGRTPEFSDHFEGYASSLQSVLPHVQFTGVSPKQRTLLFDTTGLELTFFQLSGGEREIAFLVGQIDRFGLKNGLFLIDEPELHLNADLIRSWIEFLVGTVETGQIWLATHSLEAVEAAGQKATFVLERNQANRKVDSIGRLDTRPVLSALSRAVGTPAFSISQLLFVFVEGEENVGERERFRNLARSSQNVRFLECGSCNEVLRRVSSIKALATEYHSAIRIGGVVDRDFRSTLEANDLGSKHGVFVLPVHEVENYFLHPSTLNRLLQQNGRAQQASDVIRDAADERAGSWIFGYAFATRNAKDLPEISFAAKELAKRMDWPAWQETEATINEVVMACGYGTEDQEKLRSLLRISCGAYARKRVTSEFWKECEGKQVLNAIAKASGYADASSLSQAAFVAWDNKAVPISGELTSFRSYLGAL
jgi:energy-coupling factor transporter ATP-binding protein EcfA2